MSDVHAYWPLLWCGDPSAARIVMPENVLCYEISRDLMVPNAVTMKDIKRTRDNQTNISLDTFYAYLEIINRLTRLSVTDPDKYANWGQVFIEVVPLKESAEEIADRRKLYKEEDYDGLSGPVKQLVQRWDAGQPVAYIRFWVFITSPTACLGSVVKKMFEDAQARLRSVNNPNRSRTASSDKNDMCMRNMSTNINPEALAMVDLPDCHRWMARFISLEAWLISVTHYRRTGTEAVSGLNSTADIVNPTHPGHPITAFDPTNVWAHVSENIEVDPMYKTFSKYITFHNPDLSARPQRPVDDEDDDDAWNNVDVGNDSAIPDLGDSTHQQALNNLGKHPFVFHFPDVRRVMGPLNAGVISPSVMGTRLWFEYQYGAGFLEFLKTCKSLVHVSKMRVRAMSTQQMNNIAFSRMDQPSEDLVPGFFDDDEEAEEEDNDHLENTIDPGNATREDLRNTTSNWALLSQMLGVKAPLRISSMANMTPHLIGSDGRKLAQLSTGGENVFTDVNNPLTLLRIRSTMDMHRRKERLKKEMKEIYDQMIQENNREIVIDGDEIETQEQLYAQVNARRRSRESIKAECDDIYRKKIIDEKRSHRHSFVPQFASFAREDNECEGSDHIYMGRLAQLVGTIPAEKADFEIKYRDPNMSLAGHLIAMLMSKLETAYLYGNTHKLGVMIWFGRLSAARKTNKMHHNIIITGPKFTSKSFLVDWLRMICIEGLCLGPRESSAKAAYTDMSQNGYIHVSHEAKLDMYTDGKYNKKQTSADVDSVSMMKEILTQGVLEYMQFVYDPNTGKRTWKLVRTECNRVLVWVSNIPTNRLEDAFASRFQIEHVMPIYNPMRENKTLEELSGTDGNEPRFIKEVSVNFSEFSKDIQALYFAVEEFIEKGWLAKPTLVATETCIKKAMKHLKDKMSFAGDERLKSRIREIAHIMVICVALVRYFYTPDGDGRHKTFEIIDLLKLDGMLVDTEEIGWMAVTMHSSAFENPHHADIMRALAILHDKVMKTHNTRTTCFSYSSSAPGVAEIRSQPSALSDQPAELGASLNSEPSNSRFPRFRGLSSSQSGSERPTHSVSMSSNMATVARLTHPPTEESHMDSNSISNYFRAPPPDENALTPMENSIVSNTQYDFNWVRFNYSFSELAVELNIIMETDDARFPCKMSETQVREALEEMKNVHRHLPRFAMPENCTVSDIITGQKQLVRADTLPRGHRHNDGNQENEFIGKALKFAYGKGVSTVHYSLIDHGRKRHDGPENAEMYKDLFIGVFDDMTPLHMAIVESTHRFTEDRKIVLCSTNRLLPHIPHAILLKKCTLRNPLVLKNPFFTAKSMNAYADTSIERSEIEFDTQRSMFNVEKTNFVMGCDEDTQSVQRRLSTLHIEITDVRLIRALVAYVFEKERIKKWITNKRIEVVPFPMSQLMEYQEIFKRSKNSSTITMTYPVRKRKQSQVRKEAEALQMLYGVLDSAMVVSLSSTVQSNRLFDNRPPVEDESDSEEEEVDVSLSMGYKRARIAEDASLDSSASPLFEDSRVVEPVAPPALPPSASSGSRFQFQVPSPEEMEMEQEMYEMAAAPPPTRHLRRNPLDDENSRSFVLEDSRGMDEIMEF